MNNNIVGRWEREAASLLSANALQEKAVVEYKHNEALNLLVEIVESSDDAILSKDIEGIILSWNRGAEQLYGYSAAEAIGQSVALIIPPDRSNELLALLERIRRGERIKHYETVRRRKDGTLFPVSVSISPLKNAAGRIVGASAIARDITERKQSEASLRENEARMRTIVDTAVDGIISIDEQGRIETFNPAAEHLFGYAAEEMIGQNIKLLMPSPYWEEHDSYLADYQHTGEKKIIGIGREIIGQRKDGTTFPLDLAVSEVCFGDQRKFTGIVRDLSERKRLEEQLLQAQKMESVGRLAGGIAHDFNNLLTAILGYSELASEETTESTTKHYLQHIYQAAERAAGLTHQLLAFARRQIIEPKIVDLNETILHVDKILRRLIGEDIELVMLPAPGLRPVRVDPGQIEQVILNLAVNARDAMPEGGKITIETGNVVLDADYALHHPDVVPGEHVVLAVSDTGTGMTEEVKAHIFEPFFTTKEQGKGTGLGLATCYGIIRQSGGHIWLYSEPGVGTTFKIYLPCAQEAVVPAREGPTVLPRGTETILLVEDEPLVRGFALQALRGQGYTVLEATNGHEALRIAQGYSGEIHLLLTDVVMPQMGGKLLAEQLESERPGMIVLYTSGYTDNTVVQHGMLSEGIAYLQKPYTPGSLMRKVRAVLDGHEN